MSRSFFRRQCLAEVTRRHFDVSRHRLLLGIVGPHPIRLLFRGISTRYHARASGNIRQLRHQRDDELSVGCRCEVTEFVVETRFVGD